MRVVKINITLPGAITSKSALENGSQYNVFIIWSQIKSNNTHNARQARIVRMILFARIMM